LPKELPFPSGKRPQSKRLIEDDGEEVEGFTVIWRSKCLHQAQICLCCSGFTSPFTEQA
jgi:hypothetical protein